MASNRAVGDPHSLEVGTVLSEKGLGPKLRRPFRHMQWQEKIPANVGLLMHSDVGTRVHRAKIFEPQKLAIFAKERIAQHGKIIGHLAQARLILRVHLGRDVSDLRHEGIGGDPARGLEEVDCRERRLGRRSDRLPHDAGKNVRAMSQASLQERRPVIRATDGDALRPRGANVEFAFPNADRAAFLVRWAPAMAMTGLAPCPGTMTTG
jgi:hypothetical protein